MRRGRKRGEAVPDPTIQCDLWPAATLPEYMERLRDWAVDASAKGGRAFEPPPGETDRAGLIAWWIEAWKVVRAAVMIPRLPEPPGEFKELLARTATRDTAELIALINALTGADGRRPISANSGRKPRKHCC